jgi:hypothetical protein
MTSIPRGASVVASKTQLSTTLGDEVVILGLNDEVYYGLDGAGARMWALLQTPRTIAELVDLLSAEFEVARERLETDLQALVDALHEKGLVALADPAGL